MSKRNSEDAGHSSAAADRRKKRKNRWGANEVDKTFIPGMPTMLPPNMTEEQQRLYLLQLQIEDISRKLRSGDLGIPANPEDRSPSPEPLYNAEGKRLNTRDYRTRKKLEDDRHALIQLVMTINPAYKPPMDYKPPTTKINDKVYIPQDEWPDINFVGLLIGPRGNTLKNLEKETGAKVIIRGKGSVKEGKIGRKDGMPMPGEDDELHAYITGTSAESVAKAVERINVIIKEGIEVPEAQNDLRKQQLRELALLNGTLRESEGLVKLRQLAEARDIVTNTIICASCGGAGHVAADCKARRPGDSLRGVCGDPSANPPGAPEERHKMDSEYLALMSELGVQGGPEMQMFPTPGGIPGMPAPGNVPGGAQGPPGAPRGRGRGVTGGFGPPVAPGPPAGNQGGSGGMGRGSTGAGGPGGPGGPANNTGGGWGGPPAPPRPPPWIAAAIHGDAAPKPPSLMSINVAPASKEQQSPPWSLLPPAPGRHNSTQEPGGAPPPPPPRPPPGFEQWMHQQQGYQPPGVVQSAQPPAPGVEPPPPPPPPPGGSGGWRGGWGNQQQPQQQPQPPPPPPGVSGGWGAPQNQQQHPYGQRVGWNGGSVSGYGSAPPPPPPPPR